MNYQYNYPYVAPQNLIKPKYRAPMFTKIFAIICAVICTLWLLETFTYKIDVGFKFLAYTIGITAFVMMVVSLFTSKGLIFAISSFLLTLFHISYACYYINLCIQLAIPFSYYLITVSNDILAAILLILIGLHFILKGKGLNSTAKMIFAICYISLELLSSILSFVNLVNLMMYASGYFLVINFFTVFLDLLFAVFVTLILIFFNPYKKPKQPKMPYYNNYNNFNRFNGPYNNGQYNGQV